MGLRDDEGVVHELKLLPLEMLPKLASTVLFSVRYFIKLIFLLYAFCYWNLGVVINSMFQLFGPTAH